jgi:hypothetical protein
MPTELAINITIGTLQVIIGVLTLFQRGGIIFQARRIVQEGMSPSSRICDFLVIQHSNTANLNRCIERISDSIIFQYD